MSKITTQISSSLEYENLIVEIFVQEKFLGLISQEVEGTLIFEFPTSSQVASGFATASVPIDLLQTALKKAIDHLSSTPDPG